MTWCSNDRTPSLSVSLSHCRTILYPLWWWWPDAVMIEPRLSLSVFLTATLYCTLFDVCSPPLPPLTTPLLPTPWLLPPPSLRSQPRWGPAHGAEGDIGLLLRSNCSAIVAVQLLLSVVVTMMEGSRTSSFFLFFFFLHTSFGCWTCCVVRKLESLSPETSSVAWLCCWLFLELFLNNCLSASVQFISSVLIIYTCFCRVTGAFLPLTRHWTPLAPC